MGLVLAYPKMCLRHFARSQCKVTASEFRERTKMQGDRNQYLVWSQSCQSPGPWRVFPRSEQVASSGIIPACASLSVVARKSPGYGLGLFYPTTTGVGSPARPVSTPRVCMFRDENRVLDNVL